MDDVIKSGSEMGPYYGRTFGGKAGVTSSMFLDLCLNRAGRGGNDPRPGLAGAAPSGQSHGEPRRRAQSDQEACLGGSGS